MDMLAKLKPVRVSCVADPKADPKINGTGRVPGFLWRSFSTKLLLLLLVFIAVPVAIFLQFRQTDLEKNTLLLRTAKEQGSLIARALTSLLSDFDGISIEPLAKMVEELGAGRSNVKLLYRRKALDGSYTFYLVASAPAVASGYRDEEQKALLRQGVVAGLKDNCTGDLPQTYRYRNPARLQELITSVVPVNVKTGCWVVITSQAQSEYLSSSLGRSYWDTPVVRIAGIIYLFMAVVVISLVVDIGGNLRRFGKLARRMRLGYSDDVSFAKQNRIPELHQIAQEFDGMVDSLKTSKMMIRQAAEENAHALKAPLGVICQAIEPLRHSVPHCEVRARRSIELIEQSVRRLDALASALRQIDEVIAELIRPSRQLMDLSELVRGVAAAFAESWSDNGVSLRSDIQPGLWINANEDMIEMALENILDNARSFSPIGESVLIRLRRVGDAAELTIEDRGPGVLPEHLDRIFTRYFTSRPATGSDDLLNSNREVESHSGIGLWVVRRNVEAFGGNVRAENVVPGGLRIVVVLPMTR